MSNVRTYEDVHRTLVVTVSLMSSCRLLSKKVSGLWRITPRQGQRVATQMHAERQNKTRMDVQSAMRPQN